MTHPVSAGTSPEEAPRTLRPTAGRIALAWVPEERIDPEVRAFVRRHVRRLSVEMRLDPVPAVRWFGQPVGRVDFYGDSPAPDCIPAGCLPHELPDTIGLLKGLRGAQLVATLAHECVHLKAVQSGLFVPDREAADVTAERYAEQYRRRWEGSHRG